MTCLPENVRARASANARVRVRTVDAAAPIFWPEVFERYPKFTVMVSVRIRVRQAGEGRAWCLRYCEGVSV